MEGGKEYRGSDEPNSSDIGLVSNLTQHQPSYPHLVKYPLQLGGYHKHQGGYSHQAGYHQPLGGRASHQASYHQQESGHPSHQPGYPPTTYAHTFRHQSYGYSAPSIVPEEGPVHFKSYINPSNIRGADNDSESSFKIDEKSCQLRWNTTLDNVLLDVLGEAAKEGKKTGKKWDTVVWNNLLATLSDKAGETVQSKHVENRIRQMRTEFTNFVDLKQKSGLSYDPTKQTIIASAEYWKELLSNPKDNKRFKAFKDRALKWDYEKLSLLLGNTHTTGSFSFNGADKEIEKNGDEESIDLDVGEEAISTASTKKRKRCHGRRVRGVDEVKNMLEGVNEHLALLRETIDPLTFRKQLRTAILGVQGFSKKYLNSAFKILMKNHVDAEIFLLTDEDGRVDALKELVGEIGDI